MGETFKATYVGEAEGDVEAFGVVFPAGKSADVPDRLRSKVEGNRFFKIGGGKSADKQKDETGIKAEHHGGGKFNITKGEEVLASGLSKADADAFNDLSDDEKAAYVANLSK